MKELQLKVGMNYEDIFLIYGLDRDIAYYVTYLCTGAPSLTKFPLARFPPMRFFTFGCVTGGILLSSEVLSKYNLF